ncbi:FtsX-like permease family protein [Streptomyces sp. ZYX-F-203]
MAHRPERLMLFLAWANVRQRPSTYLGTASAVFLAAVLLSMCGVLFASALLADSDEDYTGPVAVFATLGAIAVFAALFVVTSTVALGVLQRRRELSLLRGLGAGPRQVRRLITREALVVAVPVAVLGAAAGLPLAWAMGGLFARAEEIPDDFAVRADGWPLLVASGCAVSAAYVSAWAAGRRASLGAPASAQVEAGTGGYRVGPLRVLFGLLFLGGAVAMLLVAGTLTDPGLGLGFAFMDSSLAMVGLASLGPLVAKPVLMCLQPLSRLGRTSAVAHEDLRADRFRLAATAVPVMLLVTLSATMTQAGRATRDLGERGTNLWSLHVIVVIAVGFSAIAIANTTVMSVLARRVDLENLRLAGAGPRQLTAVMRWESVFAALAGVVLGVLVSLASVTAFGHAANLPLGEVLDPLLYLALALIGLVVAAVSADLATRVARPRPLVSRE